MSAEAYREYLSSIAVLTDAATVLETRMRDAASALQLERVASQDETATARARWDEQKRRLDHIAVRARRVMSDASIAPGEVLTPSEVLPVDQFAQRIALVEDAVRAAGEQQDWLTRARSQLTSVETVTSVSLPPPPSRPRAPALVAAPPPVLPAPPARRIPGWAIGAIVAGSLLIVGGGAAVISALVR